MNRIHISLKTRDLAATKAFYTDLFGSGPDKVRDDYARFQPADTPITLTFSPGEPAAFSDHFGLKLGGAAAFAAARRRLEETGRVGLVEENTTCCYAVQDKVWLADPDGRPWEVYVLTDEQGQTLPSDTGACCAPSVSSASSCCG